MFYAYSTKGGHSENDKCRNLQLKNRHGIRFHTLVFFFSQQKCNYRLITGSVFFLIRTRKKLEYKEDYSKIVLKHLLFLSGLSKMVMLAQCINIILVLKVILLYIGIAEKGPCEL